MFNNNSCYYHTIFYLSNALTQIILKRRELYNEYENRPRAIRPYPKNKKYQR